MIRVQGAGFYDGEDLSALQCQDVYRRATRSSILADIAVEKALQSGRPLGRLGLVLGTSHGELERTYDFLKEIYETDTARPLFFQNSLHQATLGFLTKRHSIVDTALSLTCGVESGNKALETAVDILNSNWVDACLVVGVDAYFPIVDLLYPSGKISEGAGALLLTKENGVLLSELNLRSNPTGLRNYDSNAIEKLARSL